jgi:hypothetical protein
MKWGQKVEKRGAEGLGYKVEGWVKGKGKAQ